MEFYCIIINFGQLFLGSMGFKVVILQKFPILQSHLYYSICWLQADIFFKTVSAISLVFFIELDTNFCFFCSFLFGAFNPISAIARNVCLSFFSCAVEAIHFSNSVPPVTFIVRLVLLGILVSLVACGFWSYLECQPARRGTYWPPFSKAIKHVSSSAEVSRPSMCAET